MSSTTNRLEQDIGSIFESIFKGIGIAISCFFVGFYELRKKKNLIIFTVALLIPVIMFAIKFFLELGENIYTLCAAVLPVMVLFVLGAIRQQKKAYYQKLFEDVGFKGKDGLTPKFISENKNGDKSTIYFKSNITLSAWKKNTEAIQTSMDCKILSIEQGNSKKIIKFEYASADHDIGTFLPWKPEYLSKENSEIVLGISIYGVVKFDFNDIAHWIVGGAPGTGKSVLVRLIAYQCFLKGFKVYIMDFKQGMEFGKIYDSFCEVVMEKPRAAEILQKLVEEGKRKGNLIRDMELKNIDEYNKRFPNDPMQRIVIIIDELAIALMAGKDKEDKENTGIITSCLENLAILGRAPGMNLVFGIQRPDANTVTGQIKSNVLGRVCGYFSERAPSEIVLSNSKATELPPPDKVKGRYMFQSGQETIEFQGYYLNDFKAMKALLEERQHDGATTIKSQQDTPETVSTAPPLKASKLKIDVDYDDC